MGNMAQVKDSPNKGRFTNGLLIAKLQSLRERYLTTQLGAEYGYSQVYSLVRGQPGDHQEEIIVLVLGQEIIRIHRRIDNGRLPAVVFSNPLGYMLRVSDKVIDARRSRSVPDSNVMHQ